jgi:anti-sigma factor (TIGR02949 family)
MEMTPPHCHGLLDSLSAYVDGELDSSLCTELEQHLAGCQNCRIVIDTLRQTIYLVQAADDAAAAPADVRDRLFRRLNLADYLHPAAEEE